MLEVVVNKNGTEIARIEIVNIETYSDGTADYKIKYIVSRGSAVGMHQRLVQFFPRKKYNALALVRQALGTLNEKELELEHNFDPDSRREETEASVSTDLARRQHPAMPEVQAWFRRLYHH